MTLDPLIAKYGTHKNGHSLFAPSASAGWLNCSGFLLANAKHPDDAGIDAAYGTVAHNVADRWHKLGRKPVKLLGRVEQAEAGGNIYDITIDEAMMEYIEEYIDWCNQVPGEHFHEQKVQFGDLMPIPDQGGTADHFAMHTVPAMHETLEDVWWLTLTDLKMGTGVRVYAKDNSQVLLYALGVFREYDWMYGFAGVTVRICQPRLNVFEIEEYTREQILAFESYVKERAALAWHEGAPRTPSPKACRWCKVEKLCAARMKQVDDVLDAIMPGEDGEVDDVKMAFSMGREYYPDDVEKLLPLEGVARAAANFPPAPRGKKPKDAPPVPKYFRNLGTPALSYALTFRRHIERLFKEIADELLERAEKGEKLPFQSLKDGRTSRDWSDKAAALEYLIDDIGLDEDRVQPRVLISVAEAEKAIRAVTKKGPKEIAKELEAQAGIKKMAGKRTLADLTDDRPDVGDLLDQTFEAEEDEDDL